jgi:YidC/Oxa1 family membrane protein insertase
LTTAIIIRVLTFPLIVSASHNGAKLSALKEVTDPIQAKMREAAKTGDQMAIQLARQDMRKVYLSADINLWKSFLPMLQIPIGFSFWRLTRNMADVPVPGMETGGFFWFTDLCFPDPLFLLPIATGLLQHLTLRVSLHCSQISYFHGLKIIH